MLWSLYHWRILGSKFSFSCSFWGKLAKIIGWRPTFLVGAPPLEILDPPLATPFLSFAKNRPQLFYLASVETVHVGFAPDKNPQRGNYVIDVTGLRNIIIMNIFQAFTMKEKKHSKLYTREATIFLRSSEHFHCVRGSCILIHFDWGSKNP